MSYFLVATIFVAIIAILYVWYVTRGLNSIPDDKLVSLDTDDDKMLIHWYNLNLKPSYDFNINDSEIASKYLQRLYNIEVDPHLLVLGTNLNTQYFQLTGVTLDVIYSSGTPHPHIDSIFDIRSTLGKSGEIAIIHDSHIRTSLQRTNNFDMTEIGFIINNELDTVARDFLRDVLKYRWEQISELNDPDVLNHDGSYLYLLNHDDSSIGFPVTVLNGVTALMTAQGSRINLLCSNYEFEALMKRWKQYSRPTITKDVNLMLNYEIKE